MQLVGHASVGIVLARAVGATNPVAAFFVGWFSHYVADFFPHGDEDVGAWTKKGNQVARFAGIVTIDGIVSLVAFVAYAMANGANWQDLHSWQPLLPSAFAAMGSFVPDVMWGTEMVFKRKLFGWFERLHSANHNFFHIHLPFRYGMPLQLAVAAVLWIWLIRVPGVA